MDIKQIVTTLILFVLMSVAMTTEKATLVWSLHILQQPNTDVITGYSILFIILEGPYLFTLLQILWNVPFIANSKDPQFPGIGNVLLGCFVCSIEAACLVFFAVEVTPILPIYILLPILNSVLLIPIFVEELHKLQGQSLQEIDILGVDHWRSRYRKWLQGFASMVACFLPIVLATLLYYRGVITGNQSVALGVTLFGLSGVNCPVIQRYILARKGELGNQPKRMTLFYTLLKILSVLLFLTIHFVHRVPERSDFLRTLKDFTYSSNFLRQEILLPLSLNYVSAIIAHGLAFAALSWCLPVYGILLPSVLSVTGAIAVGCGFLDPVLFKDYRIWDLNSLAITSFIALLIWCVPYLLNTSGWTKKPDYLFMPFEALFTTYGWNNIFFDQYLLLNFRRENSKRDSEINSEKCVVPSAQTKSRIFVCTTMYREADYEMERLLMSLQGLSFSTKFKNIFLEAHIFMDNGFTGGTFSPFAQQLIGLVHTNLGLSIQNGVCVEMPYGVQIEWTLNGGMPLVIHFKDSQKIKAKKRWSQAMYVHYILNFRLKILPSSKDLVCSDSTASSSVDSEHNSCQDASKGFSYKEIKNNSLVLEEFTGTEEYTKPKEWTDMFVVSDQLFDHKSRIGYPTLVSHKPLAFESQLEDKKTCDQNSPKGIKGTSFLGSLLFSTDSTQTQTPDSSLLSSISSQTGSLDDDNEDSDLTDDRSVKLSFENEAFVSNERKPPQRHDYKISLSCSSKNDLLELAKPDSAEDRGISKIEENILYSLKRTGLNSATSSQRINSREDIEKKKEDTKMSLIEESTVLPPSSLLELRVDNLCGQSSSKRENYLTNNVQSSEGVADDMISEDHVYILATDADMEFKDEAVIELLQVCNNDKRVGAACGRTHPQGRKNGPIVWHQIFEYAKDFWMIKNAQNVIGSVMCCPGCFSLYRASAIRQVMDKYVTPTRTPFTVYIKDTGEDRWMATLMMVQGWHMRYSCFAQNNTFCPDTFEEFLKQRRRWVLSDIANAVLVVQNLWPLMRRNSCFSLCYVLYMLNMFLNNIITPGTAIVMITAGLDLVFNVPYLYTTIPLALIVLAYSVICTRTSTRIQTYITAVLTAIMGAIFFAVVIWGSATIVRGMIQDIMIGKFHFQQHYVIMLITLSFGFAAAMHPSESYMVFYGFAYVFIFPAMHILLPLYSISNIIDQSWGTRDAQKAKLPKFPSILRCLRRKKKKDSPKLSGMEEATDNSIVGELKRLKEEEEEDDPRYQTEYNFWLHLKQTVIGTDVNTGLDKTELAEQLQHMRNRSLVGILIINGLWLVMLSVFYMGITSSLSRLNIYGVISGALYGFTLVIQMVGITACRLDHLVRYLGKIVFGHRQPFWINCKQ